MWIISLDTFYSFVNSLFTLFALLWSFDYFFKSLVSLIVSYWLPMFAIIFYSFIYRIHGRSRFRAWEFSDWHCLGCESVGWCFCTVLVVPFAFCELIGWNWNWKNCLQRILLLIFSYHWLEIPLTTLVAGSVQESQIPFPALDLTSSWLSFLLVNCYRHLCLGDPTPPPCQRNAQILTLLSFSCLTSDTLGF